ncbi:NTPase KAP family P-loop domain-containing protein 1-like [Conger conger]|uniref:NTPase KAP family P-loop domain-containing protein 1-like n=1 Tax=Conger conger TaxID=82655 RepID=UPI002A59859B|nr:NTPase KAP family P-loop domain-containing protein 1-like [Conger conger]
MVKIEEKGALLEDIYAYALSRALIKIAPPATVGLYCQCQNRIETLLKKIKIYINREAEWREHKYKLDMPRSILSSLVVLLSMMFFRPVWSMETEQRRKRVRWIFVRFSAWHFAGSDKLWAGLVIRLFKAIQQDFGGLSVSVYRATQHPFPKRFEDQSRGNWQARKMCRVPVWLAAMCAAVLCAGSCIMLYFLGFQVRTNGTLSSLSSVESVAAVTLGPPAVVVLRLVLRIGKNLLYGPGSIVQKTMNKSAVSDQLGFMNKVRKEVSILINLIHFMEVLENRKIRVILEITKLDRCSPEKIIQTLEAVNILLTGENVPFVLILAVDPRVVVNCVENSFLQHRSTNSGYDFLNKIVTLPFSVPELSENSKRRIFETLANSHLEVFADGFDGTIAHPRKSGENRHLGMEMGPHEGSLVPFIGNFSAGSEAIDPGIPWEHWARRVKTLTNDALQFVYKKGNLHSYISGDHMYMRRIINSVRMSIIILEGMRCDLSSGEDLAAWVVLANLWPCRLSWILQIVEDDQHRAAINEPGSTGEIDNGKPLWEVFRKSSVELCMLKGGAELLLEQDGDPELFEKFLKVDFRLTVGDIKRFRPCTVNLDYSIQNEMARLRGTNTRDKLNDKTHGTLPIRSLVRMSTEDICKEMQRLNFPEKYQERLRQNRLDGSSLAFGGDGEIKQVLQMALGEWISFSFRFLGAKPRASP